MPTPWQDSRDLFAQILRRHGASPEAIGDVATAWAAFQEFAQIELSGIVPSEDGEAFSIQWGTWSWNNNQPALSFSRQLAVADQDDHDDEFWQPQYWTVELQLLFPEGAAWARLDTMPWQSSETDYAPVGPERAASLAEAANFATSLPEISALWATTPVSTQLSLERAD